jgi:hypothetical protein
MLPLSRYELGRTALVASQMDQRFCYALYVPKSYNSGASAGKRYDLIIAMHGSARLVLPYRDGFAALAEEMGCFVLAPLFPIGTIEQGDADNYKYIAYRGLRYDLILLGMIAEVEARYDVRFARRAIHGFSGGGQFVHRFAYLHAETLVAASIGAPGKVTLLDDSRDWWMGTRDVPRRFGRAIDLAALRKLRLHLIVGGADVDETEIFIPEASPLWMPGANDAGRNRIERLKTLHDNLQAQGMSVEMEVVPGIAHEGLGRVLERAGVFLAKAFA